MGLSKPKKKSRWTGTSPFGLEVPLHYLFPSKIYSVPCDRIVQMAYKSNNVCDTPDWYYGWLVCLCLIN